MKNFKRILSYLMTIVMGVFLFSGIKVTNVSADETFKFETANGYFEYTINNDEITITTYSGTDEELEVPSEIDGKSVVKIGQCAFSNCYNLEKIDISDSVESIGEYAFNGCTKLKNINIPDSVRNISKGAFNFCTSLSNIEIPSSIKNIEKEAFNNCSSLESIKIPNSITSIKEKTFYNCRKLTSIEIPSSVKTIEDSAFENCSNLKYIEIPNSVTNIGPSAFEFCVNLTNIEISNSIKIIENSVFRNCRNLRNIKIPNSVTSISNWAFSFCVSLMHIEIPDSVTNIGYGAFANCGNLEKIRIPNSVINIEDNTFYECNMLTINGYKNSYVENYAKENSIKFKLISEESGLINNDFEYSIKNNEVTITRYFGIKKELKVPSEINGRIVTTIGKKTFYNCHDLQVITIPNSVTSIEDYAFKNCSGLKKIEIPDSVTNIGDSAFNECSNSLIIYGYQDSYAEDYAKKNSIRFELKNDISNKKFEYIVEKNNEITIKKYNGEDFELNIPNKIDGKTVTKIGESAFSNCNNLESVAIPDSITIIEDCAFIDCSNLESIKIPKTVVNIGKGAFYNCNELIIYGIKNSYIENYAKENSIPFIAINYGEELNIKSFTTDKESPQVISSLIKLNVEASGIGTLQYKYYTYLNGKYAVIKEWSTENNVTISPKNSGIYDICVAVKDSEGNIVRKNLKFEFVKPLKIESFTSDKQSVEKVETIVNLKIKTSGGVGEKEYKYYRYLNGEYKLLKDWSNLDSLDINLDKVGSYDIYVGVKDSTGEIIRKNLIIKAIKPLRIESFTSDKQSPQKLGTTIELTTKISGDNEAIQYKYYRYVNGKYALIKDWNTSNTITIAPKTIGNYDIYVGVKDSIGNIVRKNIKFTFK